MDAVQQLDYFQSTHFEANLIKFPARFPKQELRSGGSGSPAAQPRRFERALGVYETMIKEGCHADEKFYGVLARGCVQLHQPLKAQHPMAVGALKPWKGSHKGKRSDLEVSWGYPQSSSTLMRFSMKPTLVGVPPFMETLMW